MSEIYTDPPQSRNEAIIKATIDGTEYTAPPQSRMEDLLLELKEAIEQGGGGGTSDYTQLTHKPQVNGVELVGNKTSADLGLMPEYEVDTTPTESSENLITSGGVWSADKNINNKLQGSKTATGNPITVTDAEAMNAESVKVELEPTQDLHGYDKPWVGGAGKNKLNNASWVAQTINGVTFTPQEDGTILVNGVNDGTAESIYWLIDYSSQITPQEEQILSGLPSEYSGVAYGGNNIGSSNTDVELHQGTSYSIALLVGNSERVDNVTIYPMIRKATESADFEPYSNICPISGYSEVNVERVGKNLCPYDNFSFTSGNTWCSLAGEPASSLLDGSPVTLASGTYYVKLTDAINIDAMQIADSSGDVILSSGNGSFTLASDDTVYIRVKQTSTSTTTSGKLQIESGSTATTYEPYQGDTYTIDLDGTKYGGILDVTEGGYSDEWGYYTIDGDSVAVIEGSNGFYVCHGPNDMIPPSSQSEVGNFICDSMNVLNANAVIWENQYGICTTTDEHLANYLYIRLPFGGTIAEFNTWLQSNPISIAYKKTPSSVSTTPTDIPLLENTNNISTDGTNITLKYQPNNVIGECKAYTDEKCAKVLPQPPTTDGTYHLECSVSSGTPTITWVLNS